MSTDDAPNEAAVASIIVIMGVSGSGKTTIGALLAGRLHWELADADSFHSAANVAKVQRHSADRRRPLAVAPGNRGLDRREARCR